MHVTARLATARVCRLTASRPFGCRVGAWRRWHDVVNSGRLGSLEAEGGAPTLVRHYLALLHHQPLASAAVGATAAAALGDTLAQLTWCSGLDARFGRLLDYCQRRVGSYAVWAAALATPELEEGASPELGLGRALRYATVVGAVVGVGGELWFRRLLAAVPGVTYEVALRASFDLAAFAPVALALVCGGTLYLSTGDADHTWQRLRREWYQPLGKLWVLWGGGVTVSYLLIPVPWQPVFAFGIATVWSAYLSSRLHLPIARPPSEKDQQYAMSSYLRRERTWEGSLRHAPASVVDHVVDRPAAAGDKREEAQRSSDR